jgi:glycosyltransferase involved in cell wall biosynthesis
VYLRRCLLPAVRAVVVPSKRLERMALEVWRQPAERVYYLANGVDVAHFHGAAHGPREGADVVIGHVGRFRPEKNQQGLIRAFAQSELLRTRARLLFVGDGPELAAAQALAAALGVADRVRFAGVHRDPAPLYREMDVFALSSTTEQMPLSVLEAMATGLPVVSTRVGDVADMISEPTARWSCRWGRTRRWAMRWASWCVTPSSAARSGPPTGPTSSTRSRSIRACASASTSTWPAPVCPHAAPSPPRSSRRPPERAGQNEILSRERR